MFAAFAACRAFISLPLSRFDNSHSDSRTFDFWFRCQHAHFDICVCCSCGRWYNTALSPSLTGVRTSDTFTQWLHRCTSGTLLRLRLRPRRSKLERGDNSGFVAFSTLTPQEGHNCRSGTVSSAYSRCKSNKTKWSGTGI
jgi:hypothetical protein